MTKIASSANSKDQSAKEISVVQRTLWLLNMFYNQVLAILTILMLWIFFASLPLNNLYLWHIVLSTMAYVPLMAAAIILFSEDNMVTLYIRRTKRYWIHGVLLGISAIAVTIGISLEIHYKNDRGRSHFQSDHAILGLVSWITVLVAVIIGLAAANTRIFASFIRPVIAKFVHNFLGIAGFVLGMASLGLKLNYVETQVNTQVYTASKWALGFITVWSLLAALKSLWGQLRNIFS